MILANSLQEMTDLLSKASVKSEKVEPKVEILGDKIYRCQGSKGNWYSVRCGLTEQEQLFIACQCRAGLEGKACYHAAKVFGVHVAEMKKEKGNVVDKRSMDKSPYLKNTEKKRNLEKLGNFRV